MLGMSVKIEDNRIQNLFMQLLKKTGDLTPAMMAVSETMLKAVQRNFDMEGRPVKWLRLADATIKERMKSKVRIKDKDTKAYKRFKQKGREKEYRTKKVTPSWPGKILQVKGQVGGLLGSISPKYGANFAQVGTYGEWAKRGKLHQFGSEVIGRVGRGHKVFVPARPFFVLPEEDIKAVEKDLINYMGKI